MHKLSDVDLINRIAICAVCGPTKVRLNKNDYPRCWYRAKERQIRYFAEGKKVPDKKPWRQNKGRCCVRCGFVPEDKCQLDSDHIGGRNIEDPHNVNNLQTLCANCHRLRTNRPDLFALVPEYAVGNVEWFV